MSLSHVRPIATDPLRRDLLLPTRVVWAAEGVENAENLLTNTTRQPFLRPAPRTVFSTVGGKKAALLLDFGGEIAGGVEIVANNCSENIRSGAHFTVRFGESVSEAMTPVGEKGATNDHAVRDFHIALPWAGNTAFGNTGFRFLYMELTDAEAHMEISAVLASFTYRDIPYKGSFSCSDPLLTEIYNTSAYTVHLCMQNQLWDGVKRDRLVWFGDMHPEIMAIRTVFGDQPVVDDSLRFLDESDPLPNDPNYMTTYAMWYIQCLWDWYQHNGRRDLLVDRKAHWCGLLDHLLAIVHDEAAEVMPENELQSGYFFDWPTRDNTPASKAGVYALLAVTFDTAEKLCRLFHDEGRAQKCAEKRNALGREKLPHYGMKQVIAMMNLAGHLSNADAAPLLTENGGRGMSTFQSYYILKAVAQSAGVTEALTMLREYYGGMLQAGATTFWEDFDLDWVREGARIDRLLVPGEYDIHGDNGRFCYSGLRHSLCHGWSAGPTAFLAEEVLGIHILEAGCQKVSIRPELGDLDWARGTYPTPHGLITVEAKKENGKTVVSIDAPAAIQVVE